MLVGDILDRVDDFDPRRDYPLTIAPAEMTDLERNAASRADDIDLDLD
nr:hypothetical protein [Pseudofrankia sp. BMG5.36]